LDEVVKLLSNNPNKKKTQKLSLGRKGDNDDAVTGASKQLKSSSIDDVEIVHAVGALRVIEPFSIYNICLSVRALHQL
jgi:hypothetical protein